MPQHYRQLVLWYDKLTVCIPKIVNVKNRVMGGRLYGKYTQEELGEALRAIDSTIKKCEKVQPKLKPGTSQHTLLVRRIKALSIAAELITRELEA